MLCLLRIIAQYDMIFSILLKKKADPSIESTNNINLKTKPFWQTSLVHENLTMNSHHMVYSGKQLVYNKHIEEEKDQLYTTDHNNVLKRIHKKINTSEYPKILPPIDFIPHGVSAFSK